MSIWSAASDEDWYVEAGHGPEPGDEPPDERRACPVCEHGFLNEFTCEIETPRFEPGRTRIITSTGIVTACTHCEYAEGVR